MGRKYITKDICQNDSEKGRLYFIQIISYKAEATERGGGGYRSLQQQELVNPPPECCEIVIWWKTFISEGVLPCERKKA